MILLHKEELNTVNQKAERDKEENRTRTAEKDKLLAKRTLQINTLQGISISVVNVVSRQPNILDNYLKTFVYLCLKLS